MKRSILASMLILMTSTSVYADESATVNQGATTYDWQSCINDKTNDCVSNCSNSEDIDCSDKCPDLAKDKCLSMGLTQPQ